MRAARSRPGATHYRARQAWCRHLAAPPADSRETPSGLRCSIQSVCHGSEVKLGYCARVHEVFERLLMLHGASLQGRARRWCPQDVGAQEDLMQQTLLRLWESQPQVLMEPGLAVRSYLLTVMDNLARDRFRRAGRRPDEVLSDEIPDPALQLAGSGGGVEEQVVTRVALATCLSHLSDAERVVVELVIVRDVGGVRAAETLGLRTPTMWSRLRRALTRLRACLDDGGDDPSAAGQEVT